MSARRREIVLFSTSAIDLLACGLAAVLVLWVLTLGGTPQSNAGERQTGYGEVRLRMFGVWHFHALHVQAADFSLDRADLDVSSVDPTNAFVDGADPHIRLDRLDGVKSWTRVLPSSKPGHGRVVIETQTWEEAPGGKDAPFAGEIVVRFIGVDTPISVDVGISPCASADETHYLEVRRIDFRRPKTSRYVFQCEEDARSLFSGKFDKPEKAEEWQASFVKALRSDPTHWSPSPVDYIVLEGVSCDTAELQPLNIAFKPEGTVEAKMVSRSGTARTIDGVATVDLLAQWASAPSAVTGRP